MSTTLNPPTFPALDDSLYAAGEAVERIEHVLALIYSDLTGADENATATKVMLPGALALSAHSLRQRLEFIAERLPLLREVIISPKVEDFARAQGDISRDPSRYASAPATGRGRIGGAFE